MNKPPIIIVPSASLKEWREYFTLLFDLNIKSTNYPCDWRYFRLVTRVLTLFG